MHFKGLRSRRLASNAIIGFYSKLLGSVSYLSEKLEKPFDIVDYTVKGKNIVV